MMTAYPMLVHPYVRLLAVLGLFVGLAACALMPATRPQDLDLATMALSSQGLFRVSYLPSTEPIPINQLHTWVLHVETPDGEAVEGATVHVDGDMPEHLHGLPTQPQVTRDLGNGRYLIEGVKFQMGGWWVMDFEVKANGQSDTVSFNLLLTR